MSVGALPAEAAFLQSLPPEAQLATIQSANSLSMRTLDLQERQIDNIFEIQKSHLEAKERERQRTHELRLASAQTADGRWNKLLTFVVVICLFIFGAAGLLYRDGHWQAAASLISLAASFGAGFIAGKGYESKEKKAAEEDDKAE